jgi:hypothetical protein
MLLHLRVPSNRGLAYRDDQRLHRRRLGWHLLLRANIHAEHYAELVEGLQRIALRFNLYFKLRYATLRGIDTKL